MDRTIYIAGSSKAVKYAGRCLQGTGFTVLPDLSHHADYILLDVPSFNPVGLLRDGSSVGQLLRELSHDTVLIGGNLKQPELEGYKTLDLLQDEQYAADNAYLTAEAALDVALPYLDITVRDCPVLILGWGRIGKCLSRLLSALGAKVTVAARKETDRAALHSLGYQTADSTDLPTLSPYRLIFNTIPKLLVTRDQMVKCHPACVKIDLASCPGMDDEDVIIARGLPGIHFPESSGMLMAETILRKENLL